MFQDVTKIAALIVVCFLSACSRGDRPYGARLTLPEFTATFPLKEPNAYPLAIAATPHNPAQLLTVRINIGRGLLLVHRDLERQHEIARIPFSARHGLWSVTMKSSAFSRDIRMEVPDSETLITAHSIEFKR